MTNDTFNVIGHFSAQLYSDFGLVDSYTKNNLVVDLGRATFAQILGNLAGDFTFINKIVLGGEGHKDGLSSVPKTELDGFDGTRTQLFAEEQGLFTYPIEFTPTGINEEYAVIEYEPDYVQGDPLHQSTVKITHNANSISYEVVVPKLNGNGVEGSSAFNYSEAGLYIGNDLIVAKCFPTKTKDTSLVLKITWTITF